jgi:hypothetical protein
MKLIRSTYRHKWHDEYAWILEFNQSQRDERRHADALQVLSLTLGTQGPRWRSEVKFNPWRGTRGLVRRRLYFATQKELQWAQLSLPQLT